MKESSIWIGWYLMLLGVPLVVLAVALRDWIQRPADIYRRHCAAISVRVGRANTKRY